MTETIRKLEDVFKTVGLPPYTYVKPPYYGEVKSDVLTAGRHLLIEGPSGIGKTCVVYKIFEELGWSDGQQFRYVSCRDEQAEDRIVEFFDTGSPHTLVVDDFHLLGKQRRGEIGSALKRLSDRSFEEKEPPQVVLIGIPTAGDSLLAGALDLGPRLGVYRFERASDEEIDQLVSEGEAALNVLFDDRDVLLAESNGNFWLAQYICNKICAGEDVFETQGEVKILKFDLLAIRQRLMTELTARYMSVAVAFAKGKKWRPGGNKPYLEVLLALARFPDSVASFDKVLGLVTERRRPGIKAIRTRISEVIHDRSSGVDLRRQLAFDPDSGFSIEDPLFRYFLTHLDASRLFGELGIEEANIERGRVYTYDVGFSFAGEARTIVEAANQELKAEDVVTFYDFDQQAVLLALDLQEALATVYRESCRYYLVFLDERYKEKVWTRWEQDILTHSGRTGHIIPVVLDNEGEKGVVGIPSTVGRIDLREVQTEIDGGSGISGDGRVAIRNRLVIPMLEKLDAWVPGDSAPHIVTGGTLA
ncbi:MAG TPA: TIR domain-containing protein [Solirubrobacteraceae bacterium]